MASGGSTEDAILSGLYEVIERDAWTLNQYLLDSGFLLKRTPLVDLPPRIESCIRQIDQANLKIHLFDITNNYKRSRPFPAIILDFSWGMRRDLRRVRHPPERRDRGLTRHH